MPDNAGIIFRCWGLLGGAAAKPTGSREVGTGRTAASFLHQHRLGGQGTLHTHTLFLEGSCYFNYLVLGISSLLNDNCLTNSRYKGKQGTKQIHIWIVRNLLGVLQP